MYVVGTYIISIVDVTYTNVCINIIKTLVHQKINNPKQIQQYIINIKRELSSYITCTY